MFIPRIWSGEIERIGKKRCTPFGYAVQGIGELIGFFGLITLLGTPLYLMYRGVNGTFTWPLLWMMLIPLLIGTVGTVMVAFSWALARRKQFRYDYESNVSHWFEAGQTRSYTADDWNAEQKTQRK
jgi:hypothetical protein